MDVSKFNPTVPVRLPKITDTVCFVLGPSGKGKECWPKVRPAVVVEDWLGKEKHPTGKVRGPDGKPFARPVLDAGGVQVVKDGEPVFECYVPVGCVNLKIHLDGHARHDHNEGHNEYAGSVVYDPKKAHGTWHWPGE